MSPAFKSSGSSTPSAVSRALPRAIAMNLSGSARVEPATHGPLAVKPPDELRCREGAIGTADPCPNQSPRRRTRRGTAPRP